MSVMKFLFASSESSSSDSNESSSSDSEPSVRNPMKFSFASSESSDDEEDMDDLTERPLAKEFYEQGEDNIDIEGDLPGKRTCRKKCNLECDRTVSGLTDELKFRISRLFGGSKSDFKRKLLNHLQIQENKC